MSLITYKIPHSFTTTIKGGVSKGAFSSLNLGLYTEDDKMNVEENLNRLSQQISIPKKQIVIAHQIHKDQIAYVQSANDCLEGFDALITDKSNLCLTVTTADCVPVLLYDSKHSVIAAIHSGWRSTALHIVEKTMLKMQTLFSSEARDISAVVGPCISQKHYEVGRDLYDVFVEQKKSYANFFEKQQNGKFFFDLRSLVVSQLRSLGVTDIEVSSFCTYERDDLFFSARRQGICSGRMLTGLFL